MGTVKFPVPVWRSGENFSPMPCSAPPPLGSEGTWLAVSDVLLIGVSHERDVACGRFHHLIGAAPTFDEFCQSVIAVFLFFGCALIGNTDLSDPCIHPLCSALSVFAHGGASHAALALWQESL
jgi:hypothetical protein